MEGIRKHSTEVVVITLVVILYFLLRLPNLTAQPIFADEAIYIRWAQVMRAEPTLRFLPLSDGKTPLFMWIMIPLFKLIADPLFAGRLLSILSGFVTLLGIFAIGAKFINLRVGLWAALIYAIVPYTVFFDRMALVDSMLSAFATGSLFFALWIVKSPRLDLAMILGYLLGGGMLVKTPAMVNLLVLPTTIISVNFLKNRQKLLKIMLFWLIALGIAAVMYNLLRLGPGFQQLSSRNADYVFSLVELKGRIHDPFLPHFYDIADWFPKLLTLPVLALIIFGMVLTIIKKDKVALAILVWAALPLLIQMAFLKTFTARYLLFTIPPLLVMAGFGLETLLSRVKAGYFLKIVLALVLLLPLALHFDSLLLTDLERAPLPKAERRGYLEDWTAGYGFSQIAQFLIEKKKEGPVVVGTEGSFGTLPDGLQIYLDKADIPIIGGGSTIPAKIREAAVNNTVYFVGNKNRLPKHIDDVKLIDEFPKAKPLGDAGQDAILLYQVLR